MAYSLTQYYTPPLPSDDMPAGETPHTVILYAHDDLVDSVNPGDRVTVTGIYRATPVRLNPRQRSVKSVYRTHIDVIHFRKDDEHRSNILAILLYFEKIAWFLT